MKHHYLILISFYDTSAKKKFERNFAHYGAIKQAEKKIKEQLDFYSKVKSVENLEIELLRVDKITRIKTYTQGGKR